MRACTVIIGQYIGTNVVSSLKLSLNVTKDRYQT